MALPLFAVASRTLARSATKPRAAEWRRLIHLSRPLAKKHEEFSLTPADWDGMVYTDKGGWFNEWLFGTTTKQEEQRAHVAKSIEEEQERDWRMQHIQDCYFSDPPKHPTWEFWKETTRFLIKSDDEEGVRQMRISFKWEIGENSEYYHDKEFAAEVEAYLRKKKMERWEA